MDHWHFIIGFTSCYASILWDFRANVRFVHLYWMMALLPCHRLHVTDIYCIYMSVCQCQQNKHLHISTACQSDLHNRRVWTAFMFVQQPAKVGQYEIERESSVTLAGRSVCNQNYTTAELIRQMKLVCSAGDKITPMQTNQSSFLTLEDTVFCTLGHRCTLSSPITTTGSPPSRPAKQT